MPRPEFLLDPTSEQVPARRARLPRPAALQGLTVGLLDISKPRGNVFLDEVASHLAAHGLAVKRYQKPTYARVAPLPLRQAISAECDLVVEALAD